MNPKQAQKFVLKYLEALDCHIVEKTNSSVTVKLSPEADRELTQRPYYWNFVERTGAEPETMTYTFIFDPEKMKEEEAAREAAKAQQLQQQKENNTADTILGRYFGFVPTAATGRVPKDEVTYGSRRLNQIFQSVRCKGKYVHLFEEKNSKAAASGNASSPPSAVPSHLPAPLGANLSASSGYSSWFGVNFKVELVCDMKRSEIHSLGIQLTNGAVRENFIESLQSKRLTPKFLPNVHIEKTNYSFQRALTVLENWLEKRIRQYDHQWAETAHEGLQDELARIDGFYEELLKTAEEDKKEAVSEQYQRRKDEIFWQYHPRIEVSVINCGIFHLFHEKEEFDDGSRWISSESQ